MSILWRKGEFCLNAQMRLGKEASLPQLFTTGLFRTKFDMLLYLSVMNQNQINFENLHFNPFYNERFSDAEDGRDPDENFFNEVNTQNFECSFLFPNEIENFLSEKKNSETINGIHVNIRSLSKNFDNLLDILRDSNNSFNVKQARWWCASLHPQSLA